MLDTDESAVDFSQNVDFPAVPPGLETSIEVAGRPQPRAEARGAWPTGRTPDASSIAIDPVEVRIAADYGPPPANVFSNPMYAVRVFQQRRDLRTRLQAATDEFTRVEKARDDLLVGAAQELRGKILLAEGGEDLLAPVLEIERLALDRRSALAGTNAEYDQRAQEIEDGVESLRRQAAEKRSETDEATVALEVRKSAFERASAKKKRLYIGIRGILDAAEKAGGKLSSGQSARVAELEAAVLAHKPELERAEHDLKMAEAARAAAETDAKQIGRRVAEGARVRRALDDEFQRKIGARSEGLSESERQRADALAEVMRRLLALRGRLVEIPKDLVDRIAKADEAVTKRAWDLEKLLRGIDSYDRDAYQRGIVVMGVVVAAIVSVLAWAMVR